MAAAAAEALRVFLNSNTSVPDRTRANRILNEFQRTPEAWTLADELLRAAQQDPAWTQQCRMFAAQTMRTKLQRDFKQLPAGTPLTLVEALVAHLKNLHASSPFPLVMQLCLSIASLAVNLYGTQWKDPIKDLVHTFTQTTETLGVLLTLIGVFPEESMNQRLLVAAPQRGAFIKYLEESMPYILQLLLAYLQRSGANAEEHLRIFRTLGSWLRFGWGGIGAAAIASNPLLVAPFQALSSQLLFTVAVEDIVELINQTEDVRAQLPVIRAVLPQVIGLLPLFEKAVKEEDEEVANGLCVIFSEAADYWIPLIEQMDKDALPLLDLLLACISHPDWEIGQTGLRFWKHLLRRMTDILAAAQKEQNPQIKHAALQTVEFFKQYFAKLFDALRVILRFPTDWHEWPADQQEDFKEFRQKVGDVLKVVCEVLGDSTVLTRVYQVLTQQLAQFNGNPDLVRGWQDIEASLHTVRSIGRYVSPQENTVLPELMKMLPTLPHQQQIHYTSALIVGRYAEWLDHHPSYIMSLLSYITAGLRSKEIAAASALAFKHVCEVCARHLVPVLPNIMELFITLLPPVLDAQDLAEVIEGLARVVSVLQGQDAQRFTSQLLAPFAAKLHAYLQTQSQDYAAIRTGLESISVAFTHIRLKSSAPLVSVVQQLWPLFSSFLLQYVQEASVQEKVTKCLKCIIRCLVTDFRPCLKEASALSVQCFSTRQHACYVFLSAEILSTFCRTQVPEELQLLIHLYRSISSITLPLLLSQEQSPSVDLPDLVEEYFYFCTAGIRLGRPLLSEVQFPNSLNAALRCMGVAHREALKGVLSFLTRWCELAQPYQPGVSQHDPAMTEQAQRWLGENGPNLCRGIVHASIGPITAYCIPELGLLLKVMMKASAPYTLQWMNDVLSQLSPDLLAPEEKLVLLSDMQAGAQEGAGDLIVRALDRLEEVCDVLRRAADEA